MTTRNAAMNLEEKESLDQLLETVYYNSDFNFLRSHKGWRPASIHTFLGTPGGGKSTLVRTLIIDFLCNCKKGETIVILLSEETAIEFLSQFNKTKFNEKLDQLIIISEIELMEKLKDKRKVWMHILDILKVENASLFVFDNITTSQMYMDLKVDDQGRFALSISSLCRKLQIPIILIAHTNGAVTEGINRLIDMNDIRGSKTFVNVSHFFYILQRFQLASTIYPTLRITKHRSQEVEGSIFFLQYHKKSRIYALDKKLSFSDFKEAYKSRNAL
jgi:hypothetical protein